MSVWEFYFSLQLSFLLLVEVTGSEVLDRKLQVMDLTAIAFCMENRLPVYVFDMDEEDAVQQSLLGDRKAGSRIVH